MKYRTKSGDVLDAICSTYYGDTPFSVEEVLAANPGLAAHGAILPSGLIINLPEADDTATEQPTIRLWD